MQEASQNPSRRDFVKVVGAGACVSIAAPLVHASDKAGVKKPILGKGEHTYEADHDWGQLPAKLKWGDTHGICFDAQHRAYIIHTVHPTSQSADGVAVFDEHGKFITSWGEEFKGGGHGIEIRKEGSDEFLYCCDVNRKVFEKRTLKGEILWAKGAPREAGLYQDSQGKDKPFNPTNIAFAPDGGFYVADGYGSSYVHQYDARANYVRSFGGDGKEPGKLQCPHGVYVDRRGPEPVLVVADRGNRRLQYFTLDGKHIKFVTDELRLPCHFDVRNDVLLIPDLESRVTLFDKNNKLITHLGGSKIHGDLRPAPREKLPPGEFVHPHGCRFDRHGNIFITEWVTVGRITKLRRMA